MCAASAGVIVAVCTLRSESYRGIVRRKFPRDIRDRWRNGEWFLEKSGFIAEVGSRAHCFEVMCDCGRELSRELELLMALEINIMREIRLRDWLLNEQCRHVT